MTRNKVLTGLLLWLGVSCPSLAQQIFGLQNSNYGGLYRASYNPSVLGGSKQKFQLNLGTIGSSIDRRYFVFIGKNSIVYPLLAAHSTKELYGRSRTMGSLIDNDPVYLVSEIRWPSAMISLGKYHGIAFQIRSRGFVQGSNILDPIKNLYTKRLDTESTPAVTGSWGDFGLAQHSFSEMAFSYGVQLLDTEAQKFRFGLSVKKLFGARTAYVQGNIPHYEIRGVAGLSGSSELVVNDFNYQVGYSQINKGLKIANLFDKEQYGSGWGVDLGFTFELGSTWTNKKESYDESPVYLLRLGASITDLATIKYQTSNSYLATGYQSQGVIGQSQLERISDFGAEGFISLFPTQSDTTFTRSMKLPAALNLEADLQLIKGFFVNISRSQRVNANSDRVLDIYQPNRTTLTPRFENEDSDVAFPISFIEGNKKVAIGAMAHFGPIFLGFSNLNVLFKKKDANAMVYVGLSVWKMKRKSDN